MTSRAAERARARAVRVAGEERSCAVQARARRWRLLAIAAAAALVLVVAAIALSARDGATAGAPSARATSALFAGIPEHGIALGRAGAPVTLEEYADLQCPYCRRFAATILPRVVRGYVRTGKVRLVFRNLAFIGPDSVNAARLAATAGEQNRLWPFVDRFYADQRAENTGYVTDAFLRSVARQVPGLDVPRALRAAGSPAALRQLEQSTGRAQRLGIDSTPSFAIQRRGGRPRPLAVDTLNAAAFTRALNAAL
jgi:protein-disulfide isomerase